MGKTKIYKDSWARTPNAFYVAAMRTTDQRNAEVETENAQWIAARSAGRMAARSRPSRRNPRQAAAVKATSNPVQPE